MIRRKYALRNHLFILLLIYPIFTIGCWSSTKLARPYSPSILLQGKGDIFVEKFNYIPSEKGSVKPNQIQTDILLTTGVYIYADENIDLLITNALIKEL